CATLCEGSAYFGTQFGKECYCGPASDDFDSLGEATCTMSCSGDANETCGGRLAISVYEYTGYAGCFMDNVTDRVLTGSSFVDNDMTAEVCAELCKNAPFYGTQFGKEVRDDR
ncbi:unnamed protein product, partial [Sphacelaria rigidula]